MKLNIKPEYLKDYDPNHSGLDDWRQSQQCHLHFIFILDFSGSMNDKVNASNKSKWDLVVE